MMVTHETEMKPKRVNDQRKKKNADDGVELKPPRAEVLFGKPRSDYQHVPFEFPGVPLHGFYSALTAFLF